MCNLVNWVLEEYLSGKLSPEASKEVRRHLRDCPKCRLLAQVEILLYRLHSIS